MSLGDIQLAHLSLDEQIFHCKEDGPMSKTLGSRNKDLHSNLVHQSV